MEMQQANEGKEEILHQQQKSHMTAV